MTRRAWLLALAAVLVRAAAALSVRVIDSDSARNLQMADLIGQGRLADALRVPAPTPPLHPYLTALLAMPLGNLLWAGVAISVLLGGLSVLPLYAMTKRLWEERTATSAALLYAFLPAIVDLHAEAMTEATFMFFFLSGAWLGWRSLDDRCWLSTIVAAFSCALAWLTRPEGIYLLPLFALASILRPSRYSAPALALFGAVWLVIAYPYLSFIHAETGRWRTGLSPILQIYTDYFHGVRHPELALQDYEEYRAVARRGVVLGGGGLLLANLFGKVLFYGLGPFLILGLARPRPARGQRALLVYGWAGAAGYLIPVALSFVVAAPFSHRFLLVPAALLLPTCAAGLARAAELVRHPRALPVLVGALLVAMAIRDLRPRRSDKIGVREAGLAIRKTLGPGARVYSTCRAAEFYAGAEHREDPAGSDVYVFALGDLRAVERSLEERVAREHALLGEFPSPPRPGAAPVRVYAGRRSP